MAIRTRPRRSRPAAPTALVAAAARTPDRLSEVEAELNGDAIETFAQAIGGRAQLAATLAVASAAPEVEKVVDALADSRMRGYSLRRLCAMAGITVADLFAAYKKARFVEAHLHATSLIATKLLPVVDDVMTRAAPQDLVCPACQGLGQVNQLEPDKPPVPCRACRATGVVKSEPDLDRQKVALELGRLIDKKAGIMVQQNNAVAQTLTSHGVGALESLQQAVGELLFSPGRRRRDAPPLADPLPAPTAPEEIDVPLPFDDGEATGRAPDDDPTSDPEYLPPAS